MIRAAELSGTHGFVSQIANGYDRRLADRGEGLSGGQRQSIAIARALAGRPPVLLLDEASSGMDMQSEAALIKRLRLELKGRTVIVVTHRQPFLALVDRVIVVDRGRIVADGPRDQILATADRAGRQRHERPHPLRGLCRSRAAGRCLQHAAVGNGRVRRGLLHLGRLYRARSHRARQRPHQPDLAAAGRLQSRGRHCRRDPGEDRSVVRRGDPLVRLDRTATGSALSSSQAQYDALLAKIARLEAEVSGHPPAFPAPGPAGSGLIQQVEIEQSLYRSRLADLASLSAAGDARVAQSRRSVAEANATLASRRAALTAAVAERDTIRPLVERGIEPRMSLVQAESQAAIAQADVAAAAASIDRAQSTVAEAEAMRLQQRQDWRARAAQELAAAQADMVALQRQLPELSARVQRTVVRSPVAGRVNRVLVSTVGGTVAPGAALVEIVPGADELIVEAQVLPKDIAWVRRARVPGFASAPMMRPSMARSKAGSSRSRRTRRRTSEAGRVSTRSASRPARS